MAAAAAAKKKWIQIVAAILSIFRFDNHIVNMTESK